MSDQEQPAGRGSWGTPSRRTAAVLGDLVAVLLLVNLAMIGLATTFDGWGFLVVTGVAATLGILVALTTLRLPVAVLVAAIPIGAVLFGGPVALRATGLGAGVPDLETLADVMQGSATGWGELLTTLPNVDLAGPPALVPFLLGYVGSAVACAIALRTRSAGGPLLPLLAVLVVVLLLRRPEGGLLDWYPVGFAAVAIVWIVLRGLEFSAERSDLVRGRSRGRVGRAVAAGVVVAGSLLVAVPLTSGNPSSAGETLRGRAGEVPELDGLDSPLRRFRTFAESSTGSSQNVHRKLLFTVSGVPKGSRVRMLTMDRYDGREWLPGNGTMQGTTDDAFHRMDTRVDNPTKGRSIRAQVTLAKAFRSAWVPTVGSLTSLRFLFTDADSKRDQLRYDLATSTAVVPVGVEQGDDYEFTARLPDDRLTRSMRAWSGPVLSVEGVDRVDPFLRRLQASGAPPMRKVFVLAEHLREYGRYSDGDAPGETQYTAGHDLERLVDDFLLAPRAVGNDEQYAAAMALLANRLGVPARVAVGAVVPEDGKVRGEDVHAWVELRVADGSWRVLPTKEFMGRKPPRRDLSPAPKPQLPATVVPEPPEQQTQPEIQRKQQEQQREQAERRSLVLRVLPWLVLLALAFVVPVAKLVRRWRRRTRGRPSDRMAGAWRELVDHARDLGMPVRPTASRPAQARALARDPALSDRADDGVFSQAEPEESAVAAYWRDIMGERRGLAAGHPLPRRVWAPFNPVTLVRRPGSTSLD